MCIRDSIHPHARTHTNTHTRTRTHTHTLSLFYRALLTPQIDTDPNAFFEENRTAPGQPGKGIKIWLQKDPKDGDNLRVGQD